jgi:hypothetical protein
MAQSLEVSPENPSAVRKTEDYEFDIKKKSLERLHELKTDFLSGESRE